MQVPAEEEEKLQQLLHSQQQAGQQTLYHLPHMNLWTKLRPGVHVRFPHAESFEVLLVYQRIYLCLAVHMGMHIQFKLNEAWYIHGVIMKTCRSK